MIYSKLFDWQKQIVDSILPKKSFGLFLDCGLGKTPLSLSLAEQNRCNKVIIITIKSKATEDENVSGSWVAWAKQSNIPWKIYNKKSIEKNYSGVDHSTPELLIINYESVYNHKDLPKLSLHPAIDEFVKNISKLDSVAIIADECHKLKNMQTHQTKSLEMLKRKLISKGVKNIFTYLLTGTPFTQGYIDLYSQLKILGLQMTKTAFTDEFCIRDNRPGLYGWQQPIIGYKNINQLYDLVHKYALTIKSTDVISLPEQINIYHESEQTLFNFLMNEKLIGKNILSLGKKLHPELDWSEYNTTSKMPNPFYRNIDYPNSVYLADTPGGLWLRSRQLSIGFQGNAEQYVWYDESRIDSLKIFLREHPDNYLLFYNYTPELYKLYDVCEELEYNIDVYSGSVKSMTFYEKYESQSPEERLENNKNIILANFASGSTGKNWQLYNKCIIFSIPLYKDYEQGIKRIHRIGQKNTTIYHWFTQNNWLDKSMMKALMEKKNYSEDLFKDNFIKNNYEI